MRVEQNGRGNLQAVIELEGELAQKVPLTADEKRRFDTVGRGEKFQRRFQAAHVSGVKWRFRYSAGELRKKSDRTDNLDVSLRSPCRLYHRRAFCGEQGTGTTGEARPSSTRGGGALFFDEGAREPAEVTFDEKRSMARCLWYLQDILPAVRRRLGLGGAGTSGGYEKTASRSPILERAPAELRAEADSAPLDGLGFVRRFRRAEETRLREGEKARRDARNSRDRKLALLRAMWGRLAGM